MQIKPVILLGLSLAGAIGSPAIAAETRGLACLPVESGDQGSPVIKARVDGQGPFAFVLDTAASGTTIDPERADKLALPRDTATEQAQGMGGEITVHYHRVRSIDAGPLLLRDPTIPIFPAPRFESHDIAGLAGVDLFGDRLAVWQAGQDCVGIAKSGTRPGRGAWQPVEANWLRPWKIMLPVEIDGVAGWGLLDTGAQHTVINAAFADAIGLTTPRLLPSGTITGIDGREMPLSQGDVGAVSIGPWRWSNRSVRVGALPVFGRLSAAGDKLAILGMDWLRSQSFAIDYGKQQVWLQAQAKD
jgi:predicted aspartyl protease